MTPTATRRQTQHRSRRRLWPLLLLPVTLLAAGCVNADTVWRAYPDGQISLRSEITFRRSLLEISAYADGDMTVEDACDELVAEVVTADDMPAGVEVNRLPGDECGISLAMDGTWSEFAEIDGGAPPARPVPAGWEFVSDFDIDTLEPPSSNASDAGLSDSAETLDDLAGRLPDGLADPPALTYTVILPGSITAHNAHTVTQHDSEATFTWSWTGTEDPSTRVPVEPGSLAELLYANGQMYAATLFDHPQSLAVADPVRPPDAPDYAGDIAEPGPIEPDWMPHEAAGGESGEDGLLPTFPGVDEAPANGGNGTVPEQQTDDGTAQEPAADDIPSEPTDQQTSSPETPEVVIEPPAVPQPDGGGTATLAVLLLLVLLAFAAVAGFVVRSRGRRQRGQDTQDIQLPPGSGTFTSGGV